ncbi:diacylglycerol kinase (ATP) [Caldicellulosiruptor bescii]|uniref:Diacylglycerol kinase n=2 Tax=Caldicellulosiruptor bescii TaxID=31899 RepID=B9MRS1_CALBD|nr:diacylglycerol kinase [Caldicellulosiruptor bescii]ACM60375.1 diacylglycerol kinase [Caldicellulosiruptor bescii DSM 6725]PBC87789.1 diacylglycerol kinase (ATP) [Caldicellulosiruptor bescii]PBC90721.1 diacylglycerol kinase (ATP) [Caldicellulosiruptor bescii]PBD03846.1 diacylglycerol kinase (ATP) [Caldicellulosiruptor bescii]PBD06519.1 diacylglycerol kinase (ATP) [Caldicellulosiruptor bescii]
MNKRRTLLESFDNAINGIIIAFKTQRNMKIHFIIAFTILFLTIVFKLNKIETVLVLICIGLVIATELINTAIENTIDLIAKEFEPKAKIAKDVAAGAVLVSALMSLTIGYFLFYDKIKLPIELTLKHIRGISFHVVFLSLIIVAMVIIVVKAVTNRTKFMQGGMPSGHTALAFAAATAILMLTNNLIIVSLAVFMALLVLESRIEAKIHTVWETIVGALIGILVTLLIFKIK